MKKRKNTVTKIKRTKIIQEFTSLVRIGDGRDYKSYYICPSCNAALPIIKGTDCSCGRNVMLAAGVKPKMPTIIEMKATVSNGIVGGKIIEQIKKFRGHK